MSEFNNVSIIKKANIYFNGKVTSRTINFPDGESKTLGMMMPGEYQFDTGKKEVMEILQGEVDVLFASEQKWQHFKQGDTFNVDANSTFKITANSLTDYCCSFIDE